tara:strand:+ start:887 stop:1816 length:930 start_codon:yes stop_codon:yes gene_type:complete
MENIYQTTVSSPITFQGVGLHSGKSSEIKILPAPANHGIIFKRVDLKSDNYVKANYLNVSSAKLCTTLENNNGVKVSTIEHLLAALYFAEIDNVLIEINNEEVPIMDGSAKIFLETLNKTEIKFFNEKRNFLKVINKVELVDGERNISIEPSNDSLEIRFKLNYENNIIGNQQNTINLRRDDFDEITESRTFCLLEDIEKIKKSGLAKGGSLENAVVVDVKKILNEGGLRNKKEFVNHKILDLVGDFVLSGFRILGKVNCYQGGHLLTNMFLRKFLNESKSEKYFRIEKFNVSNNFNTETQTKIAAVSA